MSGLQYEISIDASQIPNAPDSGILIKHSLPLGYHVPDKLKYLKYEVTYTVLPLLRGHPFCRAKVASQEGWPLVRGKDEK